MVCCCVCGRVCGGSSSTLQSTSNVHTHVPHPHHTLSIHTPKIKSLCGARGSSWVHIHVQGSTSSKNPHHPQFTSKPGRRTGGAGGSTTWIHHPIHSKSTGQGDGHQPIPPPPPTKGTPRGRKRVLQVSPDVVKHDLPGWCVGWWVSGVGDGDNLRRCLLGGWGEEEPRPKGRYKDNRLGPN